MRVPGGLEKTVLRVYEPPESFQVYSSDEEDEFDSMDDKSVEDQDVLGEGKECNGEKKERIEQEDENHFKEKILEVKKMSQGKGNEEEDEECSEGDAEEYCLDASDRFYDVLNCPRLSELVIKSIAQNFNRFTDISLEELLTREDWNMLLRELPMDLPLPLNAFIPDSYYWKRACKHKFGKVNVEDHGDSYKRMYMECSCQELIERMRLSQQKRFQIHTFIHLWAPYVKKLVIDQLVAELQTSSLDQEIWDYIDLSLILPSLTRLEELHIRYGEKECGLDFDWVRFQVSKEHIDVLAESIRQLDGLRKLKIQLSLVSDDISEELWKVLREHEAIEEIHITYCHLSDGSADYIARMISLPSNRLIQLDLTDNTIGESGAKALGKALEANSCMLTYLNLKMNPIQDGGGIAIAEGLAKNTSLAEVHLGSCCLGPVTFNRFARTLKTNNSLQKLDLTNNIIDEKASLVLLATIQKNRIVQHLDIRNTGMPEELTMELRRFLDRNRKFVPTEMRDHSSFKDKLKQMNLLIENSSESPPSSPSQSPPSHR